MTFVSLSAAATYTLAISALLIGLLALVCRLNGTGTENSKTTLFDIAYVLLISYICFYQGQWITGVFCLVIRYWLLRKPIITSLSVTAVSMIGLSAIWILDFTGLFGRFWSNNPWLGFHRSCSCLSAWLWGHCGPHAHKTCAIPAVKRHPLPTT
jgi:hypothetical protein